MNKLLPRENYKTLGQHVDGLVHQWALRRTLVDSPVVKLSDLIRNDRRLQGQLDGLALFPSVVVETLVDQTAGSGDCDGRFATFSSHHANPDRAAASLVFDAETRHVLEEVFAAFACFGRVSEIPSAGLISRQGVLKLLDYNGIAGMQTDVHTRLRSAVLRREVQRSKPVLIPALQDPDPAVRFAAAWSASLLGLPEGPPVLQTFTQRPGDQADRAREILARRLDPQEIRHWHRQLADCPERINYASRIAGALGDPTLIPWLLERMDHPIYARAAGEAFSLITGADLPRLDISLPNFYIGPSDDPDDPNVDLDPDENLPIPHRAKVAHWWTKNRHRFTPGQRYLLGHPITRESAIHALKHGYQRQRAAAAIELAILSPGQPMFDVTAPGFRQQKLLASM